jgi:enoyl-[acyl-carrier protein] reductase II
MNRVLAHTGARYPIVQAPMGWIARSPLALAVSRAGGLGIIETSSGETEQCQHEIRRMVASGVPFGVNLPIRFLKDDAMLRFVCEAGIRFVTTSAGSPAKFVAPLKAAAITVYHAVPTLEAWWRAPRAAASRAPNRWARSCCCRRSASGSTCR